MDIHLDRSNEEWLVGRDVFTETEEVKESESEDMGKKKKISMKTNHLLTKQAHHQSMLKQ